MTHLLSLVIMRSVAGLGLEGSSEMECWKVDIEFEVENDHSAFKSSIRLFS